MEFLCGVQRWQPTCGNPLHAADREAGLSEPGLWFFLSVPQPHALSLSSDADEEMSVLCALTQGDQTHCQLSPGDNRFH